MKPFYITTAIVYVNAKPHIGFALELVYADMLARYMRMSGKPVKFITGTDEHGQKIAKKAMEAKKEPKAFVDEVSGDVKELVSLLEISADDFIRTTDERHRNGVAKFWETVMKNGWIYKKPYKGLYCVGCESFKLEKDLVDGKCPDHQTAPDTLEDENYFFKLTAFEDKLKSLFAERPDFVVSDERFNEMKHIVNDGLEDISISRSKKLLSWGVSVPGDEEQVVYVWFDALVNYLTGVGYGSGKGIPPEWPADVHIVGKEINRFHSILWPAMLMAAEIEVPKQIAVHGWMTVDGKKMSKTVGNVLDPFELVKDYGVEPLRYFLAREIPFHGDGDFSQARFKERYENDLANELGNLLHRAVSMTERYLDGEIPDIATFDLETVWPDYRKAMEELRFHDALSATWSLVRRLNKFVDDKEPWKLGKLEDKKPLSDVLYVLLEGLRHIAWMLLPIMPNTSVIIFERIGTSFEAQASKPLFEAMRWGELKPGALVK
ncbi:MAG: methionine--tRNA ligase, partial [Patescibacteria group bacterium]